MTRIFRFFLAASGLWFVLWPAHADASSTYSAKVAESLEMSCVPQCTLCHADANGGFGTVTRPFGESMRALGLGAARSSQLPELLQQLEAENVDSTGDGVGDVEKLRRDQDPNQIGEVSLCGDVPRYGCSLVAAPGNGGGFSAWADWMWAAPLILGWFRIGRRA